MTQEPMWQIVPCEVTPEMEAAAKAAEKDGEDFAGQFRAALAAHAKASAGRKSASKPAVPTERGEALLEDLQSGMSSMAASDLYQRILAAEKRAALSIMRGERMSDADAEDLYNYCRAKWLGSRLTLVEVPRTNISEFVQDAATKASQANAARPQYLVRQGLSVVACIPRLQENPITVLTSRDEIELKDVKQLWLIASQS